MELRWQLLAQAATARTRPNTAVYATPWLSVGLRAAVPEATRPDITPHAVA